MSIQLQTRVTALEAEVRLLKAKLEEMAEGAKPDGKPHTIKALALCPKCGEKPGYFFHVKNCKGKS